MRIWEILFYNFRSFRDVRRISFLDEVTKSVRPLSVLAGSNGTGKTTILETIEALLDFFLNPEEPNELVLEIKKSGLVCMTLELSPSDLINPNKPPAPKEPDQVIVINIAVGREDLAEVLPDDMQRHNLWASFETGLPPQSNGFAQTVQKNVALAVASKQRGETDIYGGLLYFPHNRQLRGVKGGTIEPPSKQQQVNFRFSNQDNWPGSLEQLWVWQNYLDLEQGTKDRQNLEPFVKSVENILGKDRRIQIKKGRVTVPAGWGDNGEAPRVRLDQLPSGEQQVLLLFGELARRRRPGCIIAIDEVENSLHPTLQRLAMWNLRRIAREWDAQVIVTTHSAEIINTVRGGAFINLDYPDDQFDLPLPDEADEAA